MLLHSLCKEGNARELSNILETTVLRCSHEGETNSLLVDAIESGSKECVDQILARYKPNPFKDLKYGNCDDEWNIELALDKEIPMEIVLLQNLVKQGRHDFIEEVLFGRFP